MDLVAGRVYADERRPIRHVDVFLLVVVGLLLLVGFVLLYSATNQTLKQDHLDPFLRVNKQMVTAAIGIVLILLMATFDYRFLKVYASFIYAGVVLSLILVRVPFLGSSAAGAQRWFEVAGFQITPSEFAKLGLIVMLAASLSELKHSVPTMQDVIRLRDHARAAHPRVHPARHRDVDRDGGDRGGSVPRRGRARPPSRLARGDLPRPDRGGVPARRDQDVPAGPPPGVPGSREHAGRRSLQPGPGRDRRRQRRPDRPGIPARAADDPRLRPRAAHGLHLHRGRRGVRVRRGRSSSCCCSRCSCGARSNRVPLQGSVRHLPRDRRRDHVRDPDVREHRDGDRDHADHRRPLRSCPTGGARCSRAASGWGSC